MAINPAWAQQFARGIAGPGYDYGRLGGPPPNSGNILAGVPQAWGVQRGAPMPMPQRGRPIPFPQRGGDILGMMAGPMKRRVDIPPSRIPGPGFY